MGEVLELHDHWPSRETLLLAVRSAFARGKLALGGRLVERALAAGVSWDQVASAVAQGIGEHPRWGRPRPIEPADEVSPPEAHASSAAACPGWRPRAGRALAAAGLLALGLVALEAAFGLAALLLQLISSLGAPLARAFPFADPIYTRAAFESLGYAVPVGLGVGDR